MTSLTKTVTVMQGNVKGSGELGGLPTEVRESFEGGGGG